MLHQSASLFVSLLTTFHSLPVRTNVRKISCDAVAPPRPIRNADWPNKFPAKEHCSKCGLCETSFVVNVTDACAFLPSLGMRRMDDPRLESKIHGRSRRPWLLSDPDDNMPAASDEARFGVLHEPIQLVRGVGLEGCQWTGVVTGIALSMLESGVVDAVACVAAGPRGWSDPQPILAKSSKDVLRGRGVKPALAPSLRVLDEIQNDASISRLLFCGVGCAVQAFRAIQDDLQLEEVYVLGTNCVDNSPTPDMAKSFVRDGAKIDEDNIQGYEFMQDYRVHIKTKETYRKIPYFSLPGTIAEQSIANSCLSCFDYTNGLADLVVGYMGAPLQRGEQMDQAVQTMTCRNKRGTFMKQTAIEQGRLEVVEPASGYGSFDSFAVATVLSDPVIQKIIGENVKEKGLPLWLGEAFALVLNILGPKQLNFARYSIDYHILRNYFYVLSVTGSEPSLPNSAKQVVARYVERHAKVRALGDSIRRGCDES